NRHRMLSAPITVPQHSKNQILLVYLPTNGLVKVAKKVIDKTSCFIFRFTPQQALLRIFSLIHRLEMTSLPVVVITVQRYEVNVHYRQSRHDKTAKCSYD